MSDISHVLEKAPRECWLALSQDETKVVGRGENIKEAVADAKENGEEEPVLIWAPKEWIPAVY
jgi:predicted RNase H-like HicB family nuclease